MTVRFYISELTGAGTFADMIRPVARVLLPNTDPTHRWSCVEGRANAANLIGKWLMWRDVTNAQHATLIADIRVVWLPFATGTGIPLGPDDTVGEISAANRVTLGNMFDAMHIPTEWIVGGTSIRQILKFAVRRLILRTILTNDDWTEGLDTLISAIPVLKRQNIAGKLQAVGIDTSGILGTDTVRAALRKVAMQDVVSLRELFD